jgi:hypothetical protein
VFVQTDNPTANAVAVYDRTVNGSLRTAGTYPTGGLGGVLDGSVVDHLASQGSLALDPDAHLLYAVNAGSDTITVFGVRGDRLSRRQVLPSGGAFPVAAADAALRGGLRGGERPAITVVDGGAEVVSEGYWRLFQP